MIKYLFIIYLYLLQIIICQIQIIDPIQDAMRMMNEMNRMMNNEIANDFDDMDMTGGARHVQTIVTIGSDGTQTTETIESFQTDSGIPITTVRVTKKNLKVGGDGPRVNPIKLFSGNFFLI
jgi:hypothetical protein